MRRVGNPVSKIAATVIAATAMFLRSPLICIILLNTLNDQIA